jgi:uncharacterized membrane protein YhhN
VSTAAATCVVATGAAVCGLLWADRRESRPGVWLLKPLASTGFLAVAVLVGALDSLYGQLVLAALVASWLGDVLLIPRGARAWFTAGLASFLLGHLLFGVAFVVLGVDGRFLIAALLGATIASGLALRWLWRHLEAGMRLPVVAYVVVISAMVVAAVGAGGATGRVAVAAGALLFYVSDLAVARQRFVSPGPANRLWGLPAYYAGQLLLASTAGMGVGA